ncbi:MAG: hypothetical protein M1821_000815 [Bathelium mastoideum]|nr:MAG: hypothetical protein M1821_000815 [Bathelium mastoideum]
MLSFFTDQWFERLANLERYLPAIATIAVVILAYFILFRDPLVSVPGPLLARFSPLWLIYHSRKGDMHRRMIELHEEHGKLVRLGRNEVSVSDPDTVKVIYGAGSKFRKSDWYSVWQGRRRFDLFAERDEKIHRAHRRLVNNIYSIDGLKDSETYVDESVKVFLARLLKLQHRPINMGYWAQLFAFGKYHSSYVIGEVTFSKRFGFMDTGSDDGTFRQIDIATKSAAWIGQVPWLYWLHDYLSPYIGNYLGVTARHGSLRTFAATEVEYRMGRGSDHRDILEKLIEVHRSKPGEMDQTSVLSMATSNIFAGSDTTAISIGAVLYHLCKNPLCKAKLLEEINAVQQKGQCGESISLEVARNIPYLQACIQEALRCHPAVGMSLPRVTPPDGIHVDGTFIPGGTVIGTNPWVIHQDKSIFGEDADRFRPERWLESGAGQMERFFFAFGAGARLCIGKTLSWIEMSKLIPLLLLYYDLNLADPQLEWKENCWWFVKQKDFLMTLKAKKTISEA